MCTSKTEELPIPMKSTNNTEGHGKLMNPSFQSKHINICNSNGHNKSLQLKEEKF